MSRYSDNDSYFAGRLPLVAYDPSHRNRSAHELHVEGRGDNTKKTKRESLFGKNTWVEKQFVRRRSKSRRRGDNRESHARTYVQTAEGDQFDIPTLLIDDSGAYFAPLPNDHPCRVHELVYCDQSHGLSSGRRQRVIEANNTSTRITRAHRQNGRHRYAEEPAYARANFHKYQPTMIANPNRKSPEYEYEYVELPRPSVEHTIRSTSGYVPHKRRTSTGSGYSEDPSRRREGTSQLRYDPDLSGSFGRNSRVRAQSNGRHHDGQVSPSPLIPHMRLDSR